jgi:hypothetical protein
MASHTPPHFNLTLRMDMQLITHESDQLTPENGASGDASSTLVGYKAMSSSELAKRTFIACVTYLLRNT